jgi:hypothetical protein
VSTIGGGLRIEWDRDWDRQALGQTEARRALEQATDRAVAAAKSLAPVDRAPFGGDYRDSITAIVESVGGIWRATVYSTDFKANWVERGAVSPTYTTPAQHVLQRGIEAQGINVTSGA